MFLTYITSFNAYHPSGPHVTFVITSLYASFGCDCFSDCLCFWWPWQLWWVLLRSFVECLTIGSSLLFTSWLAWGYRLPREDDHRGIVPFFSTSYRKFMLPTCVMTVGVDLGHLAERVLVSFDHRGISHSPPFPTEQFGKKLPCAAHPEEWDCDPILWEWNI